MPRDKRGVGLNRYQALIQRIFFAHWKKGTKEFDFQREELEKGATALGFASVKNIGDVPYSFRYRNQFPPDILDTQPLGKEWIIVGAGKARYRFKLVRTTRVAPRADMTVTSIPASTPEIIARYALDDEQALLAIVRYNRLIDTFLGLTTYSLQNHLRTTVKGIGQIEIDELYVGIDKRGRHYVIPVQAKGGSDKIGVVQTAQDIAFVTEKYPGVRCRAVAAQFLADRVIALFELTVESDEVKVVEERHYKLVDRDRLDPLRIIDYSD